MYHYTINTEIDFNSYDFVNAIESKKHTEGECWINTLIDHYEETLMNTKSGRVKE